MLPLQEIDTPKPYELRKSDLSPKLEDLEESAVPLEKNDSQHSLNEQSQQTIAIKFTNVSFQHDLKVLLSKLNLEIHQGESIAVVASNPSDLKYIFHYLIQGDSED